jgi:hypothetical protein
MLGASFRVFFNYSPCRRMSGVDRNRRRITYFARTNARNDRRVFVLRRVGEQVTLLMHGGAVEKPGLS